MFPKPFSFLNWIDPRIHVTDILYFLDYKVHPPPIWEEKGAASYSLNVACLACWGRGQQWSGFFFFFPYFPPVKPRCVLWSGASYSPKNTVYFFQLQNLEFNFLN